MLVDLSIGTPPQSFTTVVDLAWTDLFVPSSKCLERRCIEHHATYNASKSSTYVVNGTEIERHYAGMYTSGIISEDTVHLAGLEIKSQQFEEATQLHPVPGYWDFAYDGVLGLAPPKSGSAQNKLQPLSTMISHGLLDKNIFALKLPLDDSNDGDGELTVGSMNEDMFTGDMTKISLTEEIDPYLAGKWTVEARSVVLGGGKIVNKTLKGHAAFFDSGYPFIDLPLDLAREVIKAIGAKPTSSLFFVVPCKKRDELPNLKVNLGGFDVILTAYDYTTVMERDECAVWFDGHPGTKDEKPYLRLGSMFLKELYSIFDLDGRTIGCKLKRSLRLIQLELLSNADSLAVAKVKRDK